MSGTIVVGTDGSETAGKALREAASMAATLDATLLIVSSYEARTDRQQRNDRRDAPEDVGERLGPDADVNALLDDAKSRAEELGVKSVEVRAGEGDPADVILDAAQRSSADVIVIGNRGMSGAKRFLLGSVPNKVAHHAPCDVLIVKTT